MPITSNFIIFADEDEIAEYAKDAMQTMFKLGVITGKGGGVVDPQGTATRSEVAAMLHRFAEAVA